MVFRLAFRNLFHDRVRLGVTLVGILFSIVLVAVQLGLFLGAKKIIVSMIDNANGQLWVMGYGAKSFEEGGVLSGDQRHVALATPGVEDVVPIWSSFTEWLKPGGGSTTIVLVGADPDKRGLAPWNLIKGSAASVKEPDGVVVDKTYLEALGVKSTGEIAQIDKHRVRVTGITDGIRSFTMAPYVFTSLERARSLMGAPSPMATYLLVQTQKNVDIESVRQSLKKRLGGVEVLTKAEFRDRSLDQWLYGTGAGVALIGGALLGVLVGTVIVAQTLYSSTKDHLNEFATLRALGSSSGYIHKVILCQAALSAVLGFILGMAIALVVVELSTTTPLPIVMTPLLAFGLFALTLGMCAISAVSAIIKVTRIDPATVFTR